MPASNEPDAKARHKAERRAHIQRLLEERRAPPAPDSTVAKLQRRLRAMIGAKQGLCLSDVARYIGRPYHMLVSFAHGEARLDVEDRKRVVELLSRPKDQAGRPKPRRLDEPLPPKAPAAGRYRIEMTPAGPRIRR